MESIIIIYREKMIKISCENWRKELYKKAKKFNQVTNPKN